MVIAVLVALQRSRVLTHHDKVLSRLGYKFRKSLRSLTSVARARTSGSHTRLHNARAHTLNILRHTAHLCFIFCVHFAHSQKCINICRAASHARVPRSAQAPRLRAWPRSQIQHGMLRAHMRERERRAWPRPLIWYNVRSIVCARLSLSLSLAPHPKKISKHAPQKNQKAFAYGTEAGSGSHLANQEASGAGKAFAYGTGAGGRSHLAKLRDGARHCAELYAALRDGARHCNSALSLSFLLRIFSGAAKAPWRPAPERIRSKNERLSAQSFTRRYEMVRNTVTDRAPRAFKEQALGSRRAERASPEKADHSEQANQTPSKGGVRVAFFPVHEEDL